MRIVTSEFPNPVLTADGSDYIEACTFEILLNAEDITVDDDSCSICVPLAYSMQCEGLQKYMDEDKAEAIVHVRSTTASYSRVERFEKGSQYHILKIPKFGVAGHIEITGMIVAKDEIKKFECPGEMNEIFFESQIFNIRKGDVLAYAETQNLYIDDTELEKPLSSIFSINCADKNDGIMPDFAGEKITIYLNRETHDLYKLFRDLNGGTLRRYVNCVIVYPTLIEALKIMQQPGGEDFTELRWYRAIEARAKKIGIDNLQDYDKEPLTSVADRLLGNIVSSALKSFYELFESEINSGEEEMLGGAS